MSTDFPRVICPRCQQTRLAKMKRRHQRYMPGARPSLPLLLCDYCETQIVTLMFDLVMREMGIFELKTLIHALDATNTEADVSRPTTEGTA